MDGGRQIGSWTMVALRGGEGLWRGIYAPTIVLLVPHVEGICAPAIVLLVLQALLVDGHICLLGIREPSNVLGIRRHGWWGREEGVDEKAYNVEDVVEEMVRKENTE